MRGKETEKHMGRGKGVKNPIQVRWTFFTPTPLTPISLNPTKPWFPAQKHHWLIDHSCRKISNEKERSLLYTCCMFHFCFAGNSGVCLCYLDRKQTRFSRKARHHKWVSPVIDAAPAAQKDDFFSLLLCFSGKEGKGKPL